MVQFAMTKALQVWEFPIKSNNPCYRDQNVLKSCSHHLSLCRISWFRVSIFIRLQLPSIKSWYNLENVRFKIKAFMQKTKERGNNKTWRRCFWVYGTLNKDSFIFSTFIIINMNWCSFPLRLASLFATKFNNFSRQKL